MREVLGKIKFIINIFYPTIIKTLLITIFHTMDGRIVEPRVLGSVSCTDRKVYHTINKVSTEK